jgi:enoyl-CoA hydratase/carnithine racemase
VTFHNPPFNIFGPGTIPQLQAVISHIETDPKLKVIVFQSDVPGSFLNHYDFVRPCQSRPAADAATGLTGIPRW